LRRENYPQPYEALKALTRGNVINEASITTFIEQLDISDNLKSELKNITPWNYIGINDFGI
jgi:adenylosuccinate lyase